jgi:transcriptional regulator with XRE-family HTH domain
MAQNANKMTKKRILNRIKGVLADKDKTNIWLAEKLGKNKSTVSKWCTNDQQPTLETLFDIAEVLSVEVCELLVINKTK